MVCLPSAYPAPEPRQMRVKLTPSYVTKAPEPAKGDRVIYWDQERPGFGLIVTAPFFDAHP